MQTELRFYGRAGRSYTQKGAYVSRIWSIVYAFVVMVLAVQTQTWPVLSGCEMSPFCFMTGSISHYVHDRDFQTPWFFNEIGKQLCFFHRILINFVE